MRRQWHLHKAPFTNMAPQHNVFEDNEACVKFALLPKMSPRTKHITIPYHFFRSELKNLGIKVEAVGTKE